MSPILGVNSRNVRSGTGRSQLAPGHEPLHAEEAAAKQLPKPNSKVAGVQLGINVPYSFGEPTMSGDDVLKNCIELGLSAVELRTQPVEAFLGVPANLISAKKTTDAAGAKDNAKELATGARRSRWTAWPSSEKKYETAGVLIEIVKVDGIFKIPTTNSIMHSRWPRPWAAGPFRPRSQPRTKNSNASASLPTSTSSWLAITVTPRPLPPLGTGVLARKIQRRQR